MPALFATTGMILMTILIVIIQLISVILTVIILAEFRRIVHRRNHLFAAIEGREMLDRYHSTPAWIYILCTILILVISTTLYVFQARLP